MPYIVDKLPFLFSADDIDRLADNPAPGKCYKVTSTSTRRSFRVGHCGPGRQRARAVLAEFESKCGGRLSGPSEMDRFNDLNKQGFMKFKKPRKVKPDVPIVACGDCMDWHRKGKHTSPIAVRRARAAARKRGATMDELIALKDRG